ncbi:MAG: hypothetical protein ACI3W7_03260 [Oscillospiraceae bacterium]
MKKRMAAFTLALCLLTLSACKMTDTLGDIASQLHDANNPAQADSAPVADGGAASDSDAEYVPEPEEEVPASATDSAGEVSELPAELPVEEIPDVDLTALTLEELVTDAEGTEGQLPRITANCAGAAYINDDIDGSFRHLLDDEYCSVYYDAAKNGRILSIVIAENYDGDCSYYTPYNLDLTTGQYLTGAELLALLNADASVIGDTEIAIMAEEFEHMFGTEPGEDMADFYQEQYERTISPENAELDRVWLGYGGELYFVATIYSLAGADFYQYPMSTGLYF